MSRVVSRLACSHALAGMTLLVAFDLGCGSSGGGVSGGGSGGAAVGTGGTSSGTGGSGSGGTSATGGSVGTGGTSQTGGMAGHASTGGAAGRAATGGAGGVGGAAGVGGRGGGPGHGGASGSVGSGGAGGGASGPLTPQAAAMLMSPGWNLGNSFDSAPNETSYGNPTPTQTLINAVHAAGFKTLRLPVTWTNHIGAGPAYTVDSSWMAKVKQTAQWAVDAGMYVFVNTHHEADGTSGWVTFPSSSSAAQSVAAEVTAVWAQIATAFQSFDSHLMFECFNEPNEAGGGNTPEAQTDLNLYLEACHKAIRDTGGANATRIVMIQPVGASPIQAGIQSMQKVSFINDPNLVISLHTYYPTNFGLSTTPYAWGSASDYTSMQNSIAQQIRVWLPTQVIFIGEWGSMSAQATANRAAHALAYAQDTTTAGLVPIWWDNGGSGSSSFSLFDRTTGAQSQPTIVSGIMTGVKNGLASPNNWAKP
ncbi:MAG TPA: glycoside hydrolase family 5 protein [Polyangia bacterium]|nr:glycoside hydrolase family 5 protein [Polyangia bacterium]